MTLLSNVSTSVIHRALHQNKTTLLKRTINFCYNEFGDAQKNCRYISFNIVTPGEVTPPLPVPATINCPPYASTGFISPLKMKLPEIKSPEQIEKLRDSCSLAFKILKMVGEYIQVGITTNDIDKLVHESCISHKAYPSPLNYSGFPKSVCTSVNNVACHGIPDNRTLIDGDIISIDVSVFYKGYHGDCAASFPVGDVDNKGLNLLSVSQQALHKAIEICKDGQPLCSIGKCIESFVRDSGFNVVPAFCGHGIGTYFHGLPDIYHFDNDYEGLMKEGMTFTIEPVISEGAGNIVVLEDGWTAVTLDNSRCAQFEHTILIKKTEAEILTCERFCK